MPYVERITKDGKTRGKYYTTERKKERLRIENTEKAAARLRQLANEEFSLPDLDISFSYTGKSLEEKEKIVPEQLMNLTNKELKEMLQSIEATLKRIEKILSEKAFVEYNDLLEKISKSLEEASSVL